MGTNCKKLLKLIEEKTNILMNKKQMKLIHSLETHGNRLKWLTTFFLFLNVPNNNKKIDMQISLILIKSIIIMTAPKNSQRDG